MRLITQITLLTTFVFTAILSSGQQVHIEVLQQGEEYSDSSYYDILTVGDTYWISGKYGTLKEMDASGQLSDIEYPSKEVDIYKMDFLDENTIIASGDKGTIYTHDLNSGAWESKQIEGYEGACFYNLAVLSPQKIYISGGNSKIAHSKKTVPEGFILESLDGGITWKKIYSNPFKMVWCVKKNPYNDSLYALMYTLNKTHLFKLEDGHWQKQEKIGNSIFHEIQFESKTDYVATGGWIGKKGRIYFNDRKVVMNHSGLIWGRVANEKYELYPACDGQIVLGDHNGDFKTFGRKLNKAFSIYEAVFTSDHTAIAIGSARTILKLTIEEES